MIATIEASLCPEKGAWLLRFRRVKFGRPALSSMVASLAPQSSPVCPSHLPDAAICELSRIGTLADVT
jgi:hypothetical protein